MATMTQIPATPTPTPAPAAAPAPAGAPPRRVWGGVDTHAATHTACVLSDNGGRLGVRTFPTGAAGYQALLEWMASFGQLVEVGVEGTGSYGAGLTRHLIAATVRVAEVNRPDRSTRRRRGKTDSIDAENAARAVLAGTAAGAPKITTGPVEAVRVLRVARRSALKQQSDTIRIIKSLIITAPDPLRQRWEAMDTPALTATLTASRPDRAATIEGDIDQATRFTLRELARRWQFLHEQIRDLDKILTRLVTSINPALMEVAGVGPDVAGQLLVTCGQNADRLTSDAALAALCGASPIPASSGKTNRHRLNRGGDRAGNNALWHIALTRKSHHPATRAYVTRRLAEGRTKREITRCLKRAICRELYPLLTLDKT